MKKTLPSLGLICLLWLVVSVIVSVGQTPVIPASPQPTPIASCDTVTPNPNDDELRTQELILAELKCRRAESVGLRLQNQGLLGEVDVLTRRVNIEVERGDFFKDAALTAQKVDKNSQKMDNNAIAIQTGLEGRIADKNTELAQVHRQLDSCQSNQKWIAGISFFGGGALGFVAGRQSNSIFGNNNFRPMPQIPYTLPNLLKK